MSAVLIVIAQRMGVEGVWLTGLIAGVIILVIGLLRLGRFVAFIPSSVITGFTSGIALIIFVGQIDNFLGVKTEGAESAAPSFFGYFRGGFVPDWPTVAIGLVVIAIMLFWPAPSNRLPGSLLGIIVATVIAVVAQWPVAHIGEIPRTILLDQRLTVDAIPWEHLNELVIPALSVAALGAGRVAALRRRRLKDDRRPPANQPGIGGAGIGNIIIPFFGGGAGDGGHRPLVGRHQVRRAGAAGEHHPRAGAAWLRRCSPPIIAGAADGAGRRPHGDGGA